MRTNRTILILVGTVLLICITAIGFLYYKLHRVSDLPQHIPVAADKVFFANTGNILQLMLSGKLKQELSGKEYRHNPYLNNIPDLKKTGIDFLNGAALIEYKGMRYGLLPLEDADLFAHNVALVDKQLLNPAEVRDGFTKVFSPRDSFTMAWNDDLLVIFPKKNVAISDIQVRELLEVKKEASFAAGITYARAKKDDALAWFYLRHADLRISQPSALKGYVLYDTAFSVNACSNISQPYGRHSFTPPVCSAQNFIYTDTANRFTNQLMLQLAEIFMPAELPKIRSLTFNQLNKVFVLQGRQVLENRVVSYVYDDDFNKTAIETIQKDTVHKAFMTFVPPGHLWHSSFSSIPGESDTTFRLLTPAHLKVMAHFNQDLTQTVFPIGFKYNIQFTCQQEGGFDVYSLRFKADDLKAAVKLGWKD